MAFREKSAWVMIFALLFGGAFYGYSVTAASSYDLLASPSLPLIGVYTVLLVIVAIVGHIVIALANVSEADVPTDEREHLIFLKAARLSGVLLACGVVLASTGYLLHRQADLLFYGAFASLIVSQVAGYGMQIYLYRRSI
jgi:uncharacterized membrane protein